VNFASVVSRLTDDGVRKAIETVYLGPGEKPPDHTPWLIVVKTHGLDFELIVTASRHFPPVTLGTDATLDAALDRAMRAAEKFQVEVIYVTGVTDGPPS
jgi:hypothetical protein